MFWIWYWLSNKPFCCVSHFKYSKRNISVAARDILQPSRSLLTSSLWVNHPYLLINVKDGKRRTRILVFASAAEFASEMQQVWLLNSRSTSGRAVQGSVFSRSILHAALPWVWNQTALAHSHLVLRNLKAAERQPGFNSTLCVNALLKSQSHLKNKITLSSPSNIW